MTAPRSLGPRSNQMLTPRSERDQATAQVDNARGSLCGRVCEGRGSDRVWLRCWGHGGVAAGVYESYRGVASVAGGAVVCGGGGGGGVSGGGCGRGYGVFVCSG